MRVSPTVRCQSAALSRRAPCEQQVWSHEMSRCSTCKRCSARELDFTLCEKTCDACCLKKRKYRFYRKHAALLYENETKRPRCANELRKCSSCKCWKNIENFEKIGRRTCMQCLQSRRLARTHAKCTESNGSNVAESAQVICTESSRANSWLVLDTMDMLIFKENDAPAAPRLLRFRRKAPLAILGVQARNTKKGSPYSHRSPIVETGKP